MPRREIGLEYARDLRLTNPTLTIVPARFHAAVPPQAAAVSSMPPCRPGDVRQTRGAPPLVGPCRACRHAGNRQKGLDVIRPSDDQSARRHNVSEDGIRVRPPLASYSKGRSLALERTPHTRSTPERFVMAPSITDGAPGLSREIGCTARTQLGEGLQRRPCEPRRSRCLCWVSAGLRGAAGRRPA